ncbi:hypothetical protein F2P81_015966 [Scophthalmus maximus]|uniref:Uncharacterized protein n=1 Tax=Scophthalmus maximus TaxID=52904 RepID=A0A6A4SJV7_SCOMX|nr:hypothetical protein F2P81_015966 [Scophthalmus maximus]
MRIVVPVFVFLTVAVFHTDQMEFEAAQKNEATQMNEAVQDESEEERIESEDEDNTAEGGGNSDAAAHEDEVGQDSTQEQGENTYCASVMIHPHMGAECIPVCSLVSSRQRLTFFEVHSKSTC